LDKYEDVVIEIIQIEGVFSYIPKYKKLSCYQKFTGTRVTFFFDYRLLNQKRR